MKKVIEKTEAGQQYATAHAAHYTAKDLHEAIRLYRNIIGAHPDTQEAEYSRSQIQNIVSAVVPKQELFDAQVELALVHVAHSNPPSVAMHPIAQLVADSP